MPHLRDNKMRTSSMFCLNHQVLAFLTDSSHLPFALMWRPLPHPFPFYLQFKSYGLPAVISKSGFSLFRVYPFVREGRDYPLNTNSAGNKTILPYYIKDGLCPIKPNRCHFPNQFQLAAATEC